MYYLDRKENERFHDWAYRVYSKHLTIGDKFIKKYKNRINRFIIAECEDSKQNHEPIGEVYKKLVKSISYAGNFIDNLSYPRSISAVKKYIENIKEYELLTYFPQMRFL